MPVLDKKVPLSDGRLKMLRDARFPLPCEQPEALLVQYRKVKRVEAGVYTPLEGWSDPLGVKGGGESGTVGSIASAVNAVIDALSEFGVSDMKMPLTPLRVWEAIQGARAA